MCVGLKLFLNTDSKHNSTSILTSIMTSIYTPHQVRENKKRGPIYLVVKVIISIQYIVVKVQCGLEPATHDVAIPVRYH